MPVQPDQQDVIYYSKFGITFVCVIKSNIVPAVKII